MVEKYIKIRRQLHEHPELAFNEKNTSRLIAETLEKLKIPFQGNIAGTGILGVIQGGNPGKTLLLRADMDALPIVEENSCTYRSKEYGKMHACGHDVHVATLLMSAEQLKKRQRHLCGTIKLAFQPAEETTGGAKPMIDAGILDNPTVDFCCGFHVNPEIETGKVLIASGPLMASPDNFYITLTGKGGHCASPEKNDDLISAAGKLTEKLTKLTRLNQEDILQSVLVTVCSIHAGSSPNVMPGKVTLSGSFRTFNIVLREAVAQEIEAAAKMLAASWGIHAQTDIEFLYPPLVNHQELTERLLDSAQNTFGAPSVLTEYSPAMIGEDFAYFGQYVPSTYFYLGAKKEGHPTTLHAPNFDVDEHCIQIGADVLTNFALDLLCR